MSNIPKIVVGNHINILSGSYGDPDANYILIGTFGPGILIGGNNSDTVYAGSGNYALYGEGGNDLLIGGSGPNVLVGDSQGFSFIGSGQAISSQSLYFGTNVLLAGSGSTVLIGDEGGYDNLTTVRNATITTNYGNNLLVAGAGNAILIGDFGFDKVTYQNVTEVRNVGGVTLTGGAGNDVLAVERSFSEFSIQGDWTYGTATTPSILHPNVLAGGNGNNILVGDVYSEIDHFGATLYQDGIGGVPIVTGNTTEFNQISIGSTLIAGNGHNYLAGDRANDYFIFTNSTLSGYQQEGSDNLIGGSGNDMLIGDRNAAVILQSGVNSVSHLTTVKGSDILLGGAGNDILVGDDASLNPFYQKLGTVVVPPFLGFTNGLVADGYGTFDGNNTIDGGPGINLEWGANLTTSGGTNNTLSSTGVFSNTLFTGNLTAVEKVSNANLTVGSNTFVFDLNQHGSNGWTDVLMDFNGNSNPLTVGDPHNPDPLGMGPTITLTQQDILEFKNVPHISGNTAIQDINAQILSITPAVSQTVNAGSFFNPLTQTFVDPSTNQSHTLVEPGTAFSASYTIPSTATEVNFINGNHIVFADVPYASLLMHTNSISDLYNNPTTHTADALAHIIIV